MKNEKAIIGATVVGLLATVGIVLLRRKYKITKRYERDYADFHRHFVKPSENYKEEHHGVEYYSVR